MTASKKGRRVRWAGLASILSLGLLTACSGSNIVNADSLDEMEPITLRYANFTPASASGPFDEFAAEVSRRTDGKVTFDSYWGGSLLKGNEIMTGVRGGVADMGMVARGYYPSELPIINWTANLNTLVEEDYPLGVYQGFAAITEFSLTEPEIEEELAKSGLKVLFTLSPITRYHMACKDKVTTLEEARGKRVRSDGAISDGDIEAMGMIPVNLPIGEIYEGLQRGVIDCTVAMPKHLIAQGLREVAKHYVEVPLTGYTQYEVMSLDVWESLPPDVQEAIDDSRYVWYEAWMEAEGFELHEQLRSEAEEYDLVFHEPDQDLVDAVEQNQAKTRSELVENAPAGMSDPEGTIHRFQTLMDDWAVRLRELGYDDPSLLHGITTDEFDSDAAFGPYREEVLEHVFQ